MSYHRARFVESLEQRRLLNGAGIKYVVENQWGGEPADVAVAGGIAC